MIRGVVAIVGLPNVGKSSLFNILTHQRSSIVSDQAGVTRDRLYGTAYYDKKRQDGFLVVDTGGFEDKSQECQPFKENIVWQQSQYAIMESDLILYMLEFRDGISQMNHVLWKYLSQTNKPIIVILNKVDNLCNKQTFWDIYTLGIEEFCPMSMTQKQGFDRLLPKIHQQLSCLKENKKFSKETIDVGIVGRPNVGKSMILNVLTGSERSIVSEIPGTTRDCVDSYIRYRSRSYRLIDTAGIRRKTRVKESLEIYSVMRSLRIIERADIIILVLDAVEGVTDQDRKIFQLALSKYKPVLLVINKWDLIPNKTSQSYDHYIREIYSSKTRRENFVPLLLTSCLKNQRVHQILLWVETLTKEYEKHVPTSKLNDALQQVISEHRPSLRKSNHRPVKFYYASQIETSPPTILIRTNYAQDLRDNYKRCLKNRLRPLLGFQYIPFRISYRSKQ